MEKGKFMKIQNLDELKNFTDEIRSKNGYKDPFIWAIGRQSVGSFGKKTIKMDYAEINLKSNYASAAILINAAIKNGTKINFSDSELIVPLNKDIIGYALKKMNFLISEANGEKHKNLQILMQIDKTLKENEKFTKYISHKFCVVFIFDDVAPKSVESVYLKLYALSKNLTAPRSLNLNGAFGVLPNLAWDIYGEPVELEILRKDEISNKFGCSKNCAKIAYVDKFPRFLAHIIPENNIRILDDSKVRLGAAIAPGTTIMPGAAYVNFNAGTLGSAMVEGRISSSVIVGEGSDIGGGASILGVLSGTNGNPISIGKHCLLGANSVTGIPLGDDCIVDAGIAVLEGTKILIDEKNRAELAELNPNFDFSKEIYKGLELADLNGLHFRQNSQNGQMTVSLSKRAIKLNKDLH